MVWSIMIIDLHTSKESFLPVAVYYQFVETVYTVQENVTSFQVSVELAPSSGELLEDLTLYVSSVGGSAMSRLLITVLL